VVLVCDRDVDCDDVVWVVVDVVDVVGVVEVDGVDVVDVDVVVDGV